MNKLTTTKVLDQIHKTWQEDENSKNQIDRHIKIEQKINKIFYRKMKRDFKNEINIIHILSFAAVGLSEYDLDRITQWSN
jgi:mevalonate kinase